MNWQRTILITFIWITGAYFSVRFNPFALQLYFVLSIFILIFTNLGERRSGLSAYSVFNKDCQYIEGDLRAEQLDNEFRHRPSDYHVQTSNNNRQNSFNHPLQNTSGNHEDLLEQTRQEIISDSRRSYRSHKSNERPRRRR